MVWVSTLGLAMLHSAWHGSLGISMRSSAWHEIQVPALLCVYSRRTAKLLAHLMLGGLRFFTPALPLLPSPTFLWGDGVSYSPPHHLPLDAELASLW